jgi:putative hydrolase of the HAD superfamily
LRVHLYVTPTAIFVSDQMGVAKPNPKLYRRAVDRVGVLPSEALHVGDHPINDVDAAKRAGLKTVWNRREGKHLKATSALQPDHVAFNFWDVLEILRDVYGVRVASEPLR